jgi:hypothetical protein
MVKRTATFLALAAGCGFAQPRDFTGSKACAGCHKAIYEHWVKTPMGRSLTPAREHLSLGASAGIAAGSRTYGVQVENGELRQTEVGDGFETAHALAYAIGSGVNGLSFLIARGDHLFQAPLSYYSRPGQWGLSPGYESANAGFNRPIATGCIACHSGRPQPVPQRNGQFRQPAFLELGIGCENCHGAGGGHVRRRGPIVNPAKLTMALADDICMNCHQGGDTRIPLPGKTELDFRPGHPLIETVAIFKVPRPVDRDLLEHNESIRLSACFRASHGRMGCGSCHHPHATAVDYRAKCLTCHTKPLSAAAHPDRAGHCAQCHMPKREIGVIAHSALTNHRIVRTPSQPLPDAAASGEDLILLNPGPLPVITRMRAYGQLMELQPAYRETFEALLPQAAKAYPNDPLVLATLGRRALRQQKYDEAAAFLKRAITQGSEAASTYEDLGEAQARVGDVAGAASTLRRGVELAPFSQTLRKTLALRYIQLQRYEEARKALEDYVALFPEDGLVRRLLRQVSTP